MRAMLMTQKARTKAAAPPPPVVNFDLTTLTPAASSQSVVVSRTSGDWNWWKTVPDGQTLTPWDSKNVTRVGLYPATATFGGRSTVGQGLAISPWADAWSLQFTLTGSSFTVPYIGGDARDQAVRVLVDGQVVDVPLALGQVGDTGGYPYRATYDFGSTATRKVRLEWRNVQVAGVETAGTVTALPTTGTKICVLGDSWVQGSAAVGQPGIGGIDNSLDGWAFLMQRTTRADVYVHGIGGTGYVNTGPGDANYGALARVQQIETIKPDILVISGTQNDDGYDAASVEAAAAALYQRFSVTLPHTPIYVFGPCMYDAGLPANATSDAGTKAAALAAPNVKAYWSSREEQWTANHPEWVRAGHLTLAGDEAWSKLMSERLAPKLGGTVTDNPAIVV